MADGSTSTLTNPVTGTGTTNYIPKFTSSSAIGNSNIYDDGTNVGIGASVGINTTGPGGSLDIRTASGSLSFRSQSNNATAANNSGVLIYNTASATASTRITQLVLDPNGANASGTDYFIIQSAGDGKTDMARITGSDAVANDLTLIGPNTSQVRIKFGDPDDATIGEVGYNHSINAMRFNTNGAQRMTIDASGNLGLGVSPSAWESSFRAFDILQQSSIAAENNAFNITLNAYYDLAWKYKATGKAQRYVQYDGNYYWYTAPSGTAGNAISFTQAMTLDASGSLGVGTTSLTGYNLRVSKSVTGATTAYGISSEGQIQSDVTSSVRYFTSNATQAAGSTLTTLYHYNATQGTISGTITDQYGYFVQSNLTSATNNYGFYGNIAAGLGRWNVYMAGTANNHMSGSLAIGTTQVTGYNLNIVKNLTGSVDAFGIQSAGQIQSDVTSSANYFQATASQASGFTISNIRCFTANQGTISGTVTNQYGFSVSSGLTGATNNYGFFGNLAAASGRWNLYMNGTAANYLAGNTGIGITSPASALHIDRGNATASYLQFTAGTTTGQASTDGFDVGIDASGNAVLNQQESLAMLFNTNNSERMRITSGGNGSAITFSHSAASINSFAKIGAIYTDRSGGSEDIDLFFGTLGAGSYAERMRITSGGDVTIGSTTASGALNLYRGVGANAYLEIAGNGNTLGTSSVTIGQDGGSVGYLWNRANNALSFGTNNTERMRINLSGELLINTTSDAGDYKLQVNGNTYTNGNIELSGVSAGTRYVILTNNSTYTGNLVMQAGFGSAGAGGGIILNGHSKATEAGWVKAGISSGSGGKFAVNTQGTGAGTNVFTVDVSGNSVQNGSITTAAPSAGNAAAWKLGERVAATVVFDTSQYIQLDINGTLYYLATVTLP